MKKRLSKCLGLIIIVVVAIVYAFVMNRWERAAKEEAMDRRELHYDADGDFILIDSQEDHIGVYKAIEPIKHYWGKNTGHIKPGVYDLAICDGWIELMYRDQDERVWIIQLKDSDTDFLKDNIEQGIPVLVY